MLATFSMLELSLILIITSPTHPGRVERQPDLEKDINRPQVENLELYNALKITWFAAKDEQILCIRYYCGMMESSNLDLLSLINSPLTTILNLQSNQWLAAHPTQNADHLKVAELRTAKTCAWLRTPVLQMQSVLQETTELAANALLASREMQEVSVKEVSTTTI